MKRVLIAYATMAGSTEEVAKAVSDTLSDLGIQVDLKPVQRVGALEGYDAIVVGGPMILGWHREARRFLRKNQPVLQTKPFAVFATAMSLTAEHKSSPDELPIYIDEKLPKAPEKPDRLSLRERYATVSNYARPMLRSAKPAKPASIAFFGGRLNFGRLKWWSVLFAMLLVRAQAGDKRNWDAIRSWAADLPDRLGLLENTD